MSLKRLTIGLFIAAAITSCGGKKTINDIKVEEIKNACDFLEASEIYWTDYQAFLDKKLEEYSGKTLSDKEKMDLEDQIQKYDRLKTDLKEVAKSKDFIAADFAECKEGTARVKAVDEAVERCERREEKLAALFSTPSSVATAYLKALKNNEVEKAKELGTKDTQDMLDALNSMKMLPTIEQVNDVKCTEEGNKAKCTYCCSKDGDNEISLIKEGDKWLVNEKKEGSTEENK